MASFVPSMRLDFHSKNQEPLNRIFADTIIKYVDFLGRKGCNKTASEFCKFLLCLDPEADPFGTLLRIDYYAIRAKNYEFLKELCVRYAKEVYEDKKNTSILIMPNLLLTGALSKRMLDDQNNRAKSEFMTLSDSF